MKLEPPSAAVRINEEEEWSQPLMHSSSDYAEREVSNPYCKQALNFFIICCGFGLEVAAAMGWGRKMVRQPTTCAEFLLPVMMRINLAAAAPLNELGNATNFFLLLGIHHSP